MRMILSAYVQGTPVAPLPIDADPSLFPATGSESIGIALLRVEEARRKVGLYRNPVTGLLQFFGGTTNPLYAGTSLDFALMIMAGRQGVVFPQEAGGAFFPLDELTLHYPLRNDLPIVPHHQIHGGMYVDETVEDTYPNICWIWREGGKTVSSVPAEWRNGGMEDIGNGVLNQFTQHGYNQTAMTVRRRSYPDIHFEQKPQPLN